MGPSVGVNITCNSNCNRWCPRMLRIFCCCCKVDEIEVEKVHRISQKSRTFSSDQLPKIEDKTESQDG